MWSDIPSLESYSFSNSGNSSKLKFGFVPLISSVKDFAIWFLFPNFALDDRNVRSSTGMLDPTTCIKIDYHLGIIYINIYIYNSEMIIYIYI